MNKLKNYLKSILLYLTILIIYLLIISIFSYFEIFNYKTTNIINYIFNLIFFFILGFRISTLERRKGYLNGFIISTILVIIYALLSLIISKLSIASLVYYLTLILSSIVGGISGVPKNK